MKKITEEQKTKALVAYAECGNMTVAAKAINMSRYTLMREKNRSVSFKEEMENARAIYTDGLEKILDERIRDQSKDKMSGILLMFKLKAEMPDKYRERIDHKVDQQIRIISGVPRPAFNPQDPPKELT